VGYRKIWSLALQWHASNGLHVMLSQHVLSLLLHCTSLNFVLSIAFPFEPFGEPSEVKIACCITPSKTVVCVCVCVSLRQYKSSLQLIHNFENTGSAV